MRYSVPEQYFCRLHHVRPRFKNDIENVLIFMASEIVKIGEKPVDEFMLALTRAITLYPGNASKEQKTIANWRTEITSLLGLIEFTGDNAKPSSLSHKLNENQDLLEFFRYFLYYFQYPGGHLKPHETAKLIELGVKFKPAKYLLEVLLEGERKTGKRFGITKAEATHCIFNDLRVTRDGRSPSDTVDLILHNRDNRYEYDESGDVVRYAGDILDYMDIAGVVKSPPNYHYYHNPSNIEVIKAFVESDNYFNSYDSLYGQRDIQPRTVAAFQENWFHYVNTKLDQTLFEADLSEYIDEAEAPGVTSFIKEVLAKIRSDQELQVDIKTKAIGDVGESIVLEHEKARVTNLGLQELLHLIRKIPTSLAVGYDIQSLESDRTRRYIEVKTTISKSIINVNRFHMSTNEYNVAQSNLERYWVYRLLISRENVRLFLIQNPVERYKESLLTMQLGDGVDVTYSEKAGNWERLLV
jgi:hypothetical protein